MTKIVYAFTFYLIRVTSPVCLIFLDLIALVLRDEG